MSFRTRMPVPTDAAEIADLHVSTWREAYAHLLPEDHFSAQYIEGRHRMWKHVLGHPGDDVVVRVAESAGAIIGFAWAGPTVGAEGAERPRDRELYAIYVSAAHYGTGAGQSLLDETLGDGPAMLWVAKENPRATGFYVRNGFRFDGVERIDPHVPMITAARMVR
ncbi:GNAT family N-acetyltransferase [Microbacterium sp. zg.Y625]|uniref:GNAT family N-acetyltransferase n=1 Tax=Microbacterium jiangjiandongii TaxID=3049071 RepID=UPI00214BF248|nr:MULTISPECIES: GNAT family N-acetyltransferase [unclassified Microbacterium]MCR2794257.1 GNAT family N-acetyltransferase [Microbacterium sp. zg.Y625]WIM25450.1 GNAT family N-acetyltransferase [Microbacterium sp. zg-Y625]